MKTMQPALSQTQAVTEDNLIIQNAKAALEHHLQQDAKIILWLLVSLLVFLGTSLAGFALYPVVCEIKASQLLKEQIGTDPFQYRAALCFTYQGQMLLDSEDHLSNITLGDYSVPEWFSTGLDECHAGIFSENAQYAALLQLESQNMSDAVVNQCYALGQALFTTPELYSEETLEYIRSNLNRRVLGGVSG